jgi:hypothetical protein
MRSLWSDGLDANVEHPRALKSRVQNYKNREREAASRLAATVEEGVSSRSWGGVMQLCQQCSKDAVSKKMEVGFDPTILVGSLTAGSVYVKATSTGNCLSEWSLWRWPPKRVHATDTETNNHTTRSRGCTLNVVVYGVFGEHDSVFISGYNNRGRLKTTHTLQHPCHNFKAACIQLH